VRARDFHARRQPKPFGNWGRKYELGVSDYVRTGDVDGLLALRLGGCGTEGT
jgi:hypothetical protein